MINSFGDNILFSMNMWDWGNDIVFDISVRNDKNCVLINKKILVDVIEFVTIYNSCIGIFLVNWIKRKMII